MLEYCKHSAEEYWDSSWNLSDDSEVVLSRTGIQEGCIHRNWCSIQQENCIELAWKTTGQETDQGSSSKQWFQFF
jgi:hypothetical protein